MNFLRITHFKDSFYALPTEKAAELAKAAGAFVDKYRKSGTCKMVYCAVDMKGMVSIWNVASDDEMARVNFAYPLAPFIEIETIPLIDYEAGAKVMQKVMEAAMKATKK